MAIRILFSIKITKALFFWKRTAASPAAREPNTSTADSILSLTESTTMNSPLSIVPRKR